MMTMRRKRLDRCRQNAIFLLFFCQAADKDFWCKRPPHLQKDSNLTSIELWRKISNSTENCHIYDYEWSSVTTEQFNVNQINPYIS